MLNLTFVYKDELFFISLMEYQMHLVQLRQIDYNAGYYSKIAL